MNELLKQLNSYFAELQVLQKDNDGILKYLPNDLKQCIKDGKDLLVKEKNNKSEVVAKTVSVQGGMGEPESGGKKMDGCDSEKVVKDWFHSVIAEINAVEKTISKGQQQTFDIDAAKSYAGKAFPTEASNISLEQFMLGRLCNYIVNDKMSDFSEINDVIGVTLNENHIKKIAELWANSAKGNCLTEADLPKTDFLAKRLLMLYIESTKDSGYGIFSDIDPGSEGTDIYAGYIYFGIDEVLVAMTKNGFEVKSRRDATISLDDVVDGQNVIRSLKDLYGENTKLVNLPIKMKLSVEIILADPTDFYGGASGGVRMVFDKSIGGRWTQVFAKEQLWKNQLDAMGLTNEEFSVFITHNLLDAYKLKDLKGDLGAILGL